MALPTFKYHPDPLATGAIIAADDECACCSQSRGYIYTGPVYSEEELDNALCPWCIADGSAHAQFDASFTDEAGIGGGGEWDDVADAVREEIAYRTPGFAGWQQERWWSHCQGAAAFIGRAGKSELQALGQEAILAIQNDAGLDDGPDWDEFFNALDKDGSPTAYLFRCTCCGTLGGYQDCD
ncbi:CbrC family protein [Chitinilyticum litopenaei]|uniref:CbrC family protein n=1 Tax=Chitinilyticum litopenaei TaxID=1121276 RepID=UPI000412D79F|nr:CbrC family protein [Chitinilyticum litopenaei]